MVIVGAGPAGIGMALTLAKLLAIQVRSAGPHYTQVTIWSDGGAPRFTVIGGNESSADAAVRLVRLRRTVRLLFKPAQFDGVPHGADQTASWLIGLLVEFPGLTTLRRLLFSDRRRIRYRDLPVITTDT